MHGYQIGKQPLYQAYQAYQALALLVMKPEQQTSVKMESIGSLLEKVYSPHFINYLSFMYFIIIIIFSTLF